jgi:hypothetical protein
VKDTIRIDVAIAEDIARAVAAGLSRAVDPRALAILTPLFGLMETSGADVLGAASSMEFELHWPESIPGHARQTIRAQIKGEMQSQVMRTLGAQGKAMIFFQTQCVSVVLNAITEQMRAASNV